MLFKSFVALAVIALLCAAAAASDCSNKPNGRYCISATTYDWCYSSGSSATLQCPMGTQCLCSYVADGNPCGYAGTASTISGCEIANLPQNPPAQPPALPQQPPAHQARQPAHVPAKQPAQVPVKQPAQVPAKQPAQVPAKQPAVQQPAAKPQNPPPPPPPPAQPVTIQPSGTCSVSSVSAAGSAKKFITYFTNWAQYRTGNCVFDPSMIQGNLYTHINFAFAKVDPASFAVQPYEWNDLTDTVAGVAQGNYDKVNAVKVKYPHLKTLISLGGWSFGATIFSNMASTASNRAAFISSAISFARNNNFDGIDIDWEYPANAAQGGKPEDTINFSSLLKELRAAVESENRGIKDKLLLSIAAPAGAESFAGLQLNVIHQYLDHINLMTYDMHGSWETNTGFHTPLYCPSGDTVCIDYAVNAYLAAGTPSSKIILGLGTYGRSWTLANPANNNPGAAAPSAGTAGACSGEAGTLSYYEIKDMLAAGATEKVDAVAVAAYAYLGNQWVSYDSPATIKSKIEYANAKALGGAMVWALDLDAPRAGFYELQCTAASNLFGGGGGSTVGASKAAGSSDSFPNGATVNAVDATAASDRLSPAVSVIFAVVAGAAVFLALAAFN